MSDGSLKHVCDNCAAGFKTRKQLDVHLRTVCAEYQREALDREATVLQRALTDNPTLQSKSQIPIREPEVPDRPAPSAATSRRQLPSDFVDPEPPAEPEGTPAGSDGQRTEYHPEAGKTYGKVKPDQRRFDTRKSSNTNPWYPFVNGNDYRWGRSFVRSNATQAEISEFFNSGMHLHVNELPKPSDRLSFDSKYTLDKVVDQMDPDFNHNNWSTGIANYPQGPVPFYYRSIREVIEYLLSQPAFKDHLVYIPRKEFNAEGKRVYSDLTNGDWYWRTQDEVAEGITVIPVLFTSDVTMLDNFSGGAGAWPIYMTLGNFDSTIRNRPSMNTWVQIAALPIAQKQPINATPAELERLRNQKQEVIHQVLEQIFAELRVHEEQKGFFVRCSDRLLRRCLPVAACYMADYLEYTKLFGLVNNACPVCEVTLNKTGDPVASCGGSIRDCQEYQRKFNDLVASEKELASFRRLHTNSQAIKRPGMVPSQLDESLFDTEDGTYLGKTFEHYNYHMSIVANRLAWFDLRRVHPTANAFWNVPRARYSTLWKPDMLHTLYLGMFKHMMEWLTDFLGARKRMTAFDDAWRRIPRYPGLVAPSKTYSEVKQWAGKDMRNLARFLYPCLCIALWEPDTDSRRVADPVIRRVLLCVEALVKFNMMCQYRSFDEESIGYMEEYYAQFHKHKDVFLEFRASLTVRKAARANAKEYRDNNLAVVDARTPAGSGGSKSSTTKRKRTATQSANDPTPKTTKPSGQQSKTPSSHGQRALPFLPIPTQNIQLPGERSLTATEQRQVIRADAKSIEKQLLLQEANFNFPKIHLMGHFMGTIPDFGALTLYSTEVGETLHQLIKLCRKISNKNAGSEKSILIYYIRRYVLRMRELNLMQLSKDGYFREEIKVVLHLYNNSKERNEASRRNRLGLPLASQSTVDESEDLTAGCSDDEGELARTLQDRSDEQVDKDQAASLDSDAGVDASPESADILFGDANLPKVTLLSGVVKTPVHRRTLSTIAADYRIPTLRYSALEYFELELTESNLHWVESIYCEAYQAVKIAVPIHQSEGSELMTARCTGLRGFGRKKLPINDSVFYRDAASNQATSAGQFSGYTIGHLKCLLKITIPPGTLTSPDSADETFHRLALVLPCDYEGAKAEMFREEPWIPRCKPRDIGRIRNLQRAMEAREGILIDIATIARLAHIIPFHDKNESDPDNIRWMVNNMVDNGSWYDFH